MSGVAHQVARRVLLLTILTGCGGDPKPEQDLIITKLAPSGGVEATRPIDVRFSKPIVEASQVGRSAPGSLLAISPSLPSRHEWVAPDHLRVTPSVPFAPSMRYRVTVPLDATGGRLLSGRNTFSFHTPMFGLASLDTEVTEGSHPSVRVNAAFTRTVDPRAAAAHVRFFHQGHRIDAQLETDTPGTVMTYRLPPTPTTELSIRVSEHLMPMGVGERLGKTVERALPVDPPFEVELIRFTQMPAPGVELRFTGPLDRESARRIAVTPALPLRRVWTDRGLLLEGAFVPAERYQVVVPAGVTAADGRALALPVESEVVVPDRSPAIRFKNRDATLLSVAERQVTVETINVSHLDVRIIKVFAENLSSVLPSIRGKAPAPKSLGRVIHQARLRVQTRPNEVSHTVVRFEDPQWRRAGLYRVEVSRDWVKAKKWMVVSDLELTAKLNDGYAHVEVLSRSTGKPVSGANVRLLSAGNTSVGEGRTDARGLLRINAPTDTVALVAARSGADAAFLPVVESTRIPLNHQHQVGASESTGPYEAYVFMPRGRYRPGETLVATVIVRDRQLNTPVPFPFRVVLRDPAGKAARSFEGARGRDGTQQFTVQLPLDAVTGRWRLTVETNADEEIGHGELRVDAAPPARLAVEIDPPVHGRIDQPLEFTVRARPLFGTTINEAEAHVRCRVEVVPFAARGFEAFRFDQDERPDPVLVDLGRHPLQEGQVKQVCPIPPALPGQGPLNVTMLATIFEVGGTAASAAQSIRLHHRQRYVGIRRNSPQFFVDEGSDASLEVVVLDEEGRPVEGVPLVAKVHELTEHPVFAWTDGGYTRSRTERSQWLETLSVTSGSAPVPLPYTPGRAGTVQVLLQGPQNARVATRFHVSGAAESTSELLLTPDRSRYEVGQTANVRISAPTSPTRLRLSIERDRVLWSRIVRLDGAVNEVRVPILESMSPNAFLVAQPIGGAKVAVVPLSIDHQRYVLPVEVSVPAQIKPGEPLRVTMSTDRPAHFTVALVDEALLRTDDFQNPDPFAFFTRERRLSLRTYSLFGNGQGTAPEPAAAVDALESSGGAPRSSLTIQSKIVHAPAGRAELVLDVPPFFGTARVMVVGFSRDRFGAASRRVNVTDPLVVVPQAPKLVRTLDRFEASVRLYNTTAQPTQVTLGLTATGPLAVRGATSRALTIAPGAEQIVGFEVEADEVAGAGTLTFDHAGNPQTLQVEVSPIRSRTSVGAQAVVAHKRPATFTLPAGLQVTDVRLEATPNPASRFGAALDAVLRSEHGTVEHLVSRGLALLHQPGDDRLAEHLSRITALVGAAGRLQRFPGGPRAAPWSTVYAAHLLVEARRAGQPVDRAALERLLSHVSGLSAVPEERVRAYAAYVSALAGRPTDAGPSPTPTTNELRALWAGAFFHAKRWPQVTALLAAPMSATGRTDRTPHYSVVQADALALSVLADVRPDHPSISNLLDVLAQRSKDGRWANHAENALALHALTKLGRRMPGRRPFWGAVALDGVELKKFNSTRPLLLQPAVEEWAQKSLELTVTGAGKAHAGLVVSGISKTAEERLPGLTLERTLLDLHGKPLEGPPAKGSLVHVMLEVTAPSDHEDVAVREPLPAGLVLEDPQSATPETTKPFYVDVASDRLIFYTRVSAGKPTRLRYRARAAVRGTFIHPPARAELPHQPARHALTPQQTLQVR